MEVMDVMEGSRRRSLRKREEKSYAESPDLIIEDDGTTSRRRVMMDASGSVVVTPSKPGSGIIGVPALPPKEIYPGTIIHNGDIEMESENEEDEISAPVSAIPLPKVINPAPMGYVRS